MQIRSVVPSFLMVDVALSDKNTDAEDFAFEEYAEDRHVAHAQDVELCKRRAMGSTAHRPNRWFHVVPGSDPNHPKL